MPEVDFVFCTMAENSNEALRGKQCGNAKLTKNDVCNIWLELKKKINQLRSYPMILGFVRAPYGISKKNIHGQS